MSTKVRVLFESVGLAVRGPVRWGEPVSDSRPGVYCVSHSEDPDLASGATTWQPHLDMTAISQWIDYVSDMRLDRGSARPTPTDVRDRLLGFWLPDEPVLYIGKAGSVVPSNRGIDDRIGDLYDHRLGESSPHRGGHWLHTLEDLCHKFVFWSPVVDGRVPVDVEHAMIRVFASNVSEESRCRLRDPRNPFPWANLELTAARRKAHGLSRQTI